jgi:hypothetical protein
MQIKSFTVYRGDTTNLSWSVSEDLSGKVLIFGVKASKKLNDIRLIEKTPIYNTGIIYTTINASDTENILYQNLYYDLVNVTDNTTLATGKIILQADVITKSDGYLQGQIDDDSITNYSVWSSQKTNNELQAEANLRTSADANLQSQITTLQASSHTHSNKSLLDTYTQSEANLADAVAKKHSHANQTILDNTNESFTTSLKSNYDNHLANTNNPHSVTKAQIGLSNVTNDAQLKRADGDINSFTEKTSLVDNDITLIEDSASSYSKKKTKISTIKASLQSGYDLRYAIKEQFATPNGVIFDGVDDFYLMADNINHQFTENSKFCFEALFMQDRLLPSTSHGAYIIGKPAKYGIGVYGNNNRLHLGIRGSSEKNSYSDNIPIELGKLYHIVFNYDGANSNFWINGIKYSKDFSGSGLTDGSGVIYIGYYTLGGTPAYFPGKIYLARIYNRTLSDSEVVRLYNNGKPDLVELSYVDKNASQSALTSGTLNFSKRYRIDNYVSGDDFTNLGAGSNASGVEFIATGTTPTTWSNGSSLRQIGCVAEYKAENAGTLGWLETQNQLHAISAGNPIAPAGLKDYKSSISTTTVQFVNSQKAQTVLKQIIVKNNYAGSNTVSLGTTTSANELVNASSLSSGETKVIDVNSYSASERSLYAKAGLSSVDLTLIFDKVAR